MQNLLLPEQVYEWPPLQVADKCLVDLAFPCTQGTPWDQVLLSRQGMTSLQHSDTENISKGICCLLEGGRDLQRDLHGWA